MSWIALQAPIGRSILVVAALALAACTSAGTGGTTGTGATTPVMTLPAVTLPGATTPAGSVGGGGGSVGGTGTAQVDLTFTGTYPFVAKGTAGRCIVSTGNPARFGFEGTESDYPGLGVSFSVAEITAGYVDIKWLKDNATSWGNSMNSAIRLSADHHSVTIDEELSPFAPAGGAPAGPEHVEGTISCP